MRSILVLSVVLMSGAPLLAQVGPFGIPGTGDYTVSADPVNVKVGETFTVPVHIDTASPVTWFGLFITSEFAVCNPIGFLLGAGAEAYEAANGPFPCDVGISPGQIFLNMTFFATPYDSAVYGTEIALLEFEVTATAAATSSIEILDAFTMLPELSVPVTVGDVEPEFLRGDANGDGACSLPDAIKILNLLFTPGETSDCWDSADVEDDGQLTIGDAIRMLQFLFVDPTGMPIGCSLDATVDGLTCDRDSCL